MIKQRCPFELLQTLRQHFTDTYIAVKLEVPWVHVHEWLEAGHVPHRYFKQLNLLLLETTQPTN